MRWTDELWDEVWERTLSGIERTRIARTTLSRRPPVDALEQRLVPELARRWRRSARNHALGHGVLLSFWLALLLRYGTDDADLRAVTLVLGAVSGAVVAGALWLRRHLAPVAGSSWPAGPA